MPACADDKRSFDTVVKNPVITVTVDGLKGLTKLKPCR